MAAMITMVTEPFHSSQQRPRLPPMFRVTKDSDYLTIAATPDEIGRNLAHAPRGRFTVEEVSLAQDLLPSDHLCRRWGAAIRHDDGHGTLDPDPSPA
jgi:hypothetical protein